MRARTPFRIQKFNKRHGAEALKAVYRALPAQVRQKVGLLIPRKIIDPVSSQAELERRIVEFARAHPNTRRILIRGNTAEANTAKRIETHVTNPRGHFSTALRRFKWDTLPAGFDVRSPFAVEWLLYKTRNRSRIHGEGKVVIEPSSDVSSNIDVKVFYRINSPRKPRAKRSKNLRVEHYFALHLNEGIRLSEKVLSYGNKNVRLDVKAIRDLCKAILEQNPIELTRGEMFEMKFVTWKGGKGKPEFFDLIKG